MSTKDFVPDVAQDAPLQLSRKRSGSTDYYPKEKKRVSLFNAPPSSENSKVKTTAQTMTLSTMTSSKTLNEDKTYTVCYLCDLNFNTQLELEEHLYSLLHHRTVQADKGKGCLTCTHYCNLCNVKTVHLSSFVAHLKKKEHKDKQELRAKQIKDQTYQVNLNNLLKHETIRSTTNKQPDLIENQATSTHIPVVITTPPRNDFPLTSNDLFNSNYETSNFGNKAWNKKLNQNYDNNDNYFYGNHDNYQHGNRGYSNNNKDNGYHGNSYPRQPFDRRYDFNDRNHDNHENLHGYNDDDYHYRSISGFDYRKNNGGFNFQNDTSNGYNGFNGEYGNYKYTSFSRPSSAHSFYKSDIFNSRQERPNSTEPYRSNYSTMQKNNVPTMSKYKGLFTLPKNNEKAHSKYNGHATMPKYNANSFNIPITLSNNNEENKGPTTMPNYDITKPNTMSKYNEKTPLFTSNASTMQKNGVTMSKNNVPTKKSLLPMPASFTSKKIGMESDNQNKTEKIFRSVIDEITQPSVTSMEDKTSAPDSLSTLSRVSNSSMLQEEIALKVQLKLTQLYRKKQLEKLSQNKRETETPSDKSSSQSETNSLQNKEFNSENLNTNNGHKKGLKKKISTDLGTTNKRDDKTTEPTKSKFPKPNIEKCRSRVVSKSDTSDTDTREKQQSIRVAKLLHEIDNKRKNNPTSTKRKLTGPRFGISLVGASNTAPIISQETSTMTSQEKLSITSQDSEINEIVASIKNMEDLLELGSKGNPPFSHQVDASTIETAEQKPDLQNFNQFSHPIIDATPTITSVYTMKDKKPLNSQEIDNSQPKISNFESNPTFNTFNKLTTNTTTSFHPLHTNITQHDPKITSKKLYDPIQPNIDGRPRQCSYPSVSHSTSPDTTTNVGLKTNQQKLMELSEKEDKIYSETRNLEAEIMQVNDLIEQLNKRKVELLSNTEQCHSQLVEIKKERLNLLRGNQIKSLNSEPTTLAVVTNMPPLVANIPPLVANTPPLRTNTPPRVGSLKHSTPTPPTRPNLDFSVSIKKEFPDSTISSVSNYSETYYETAVASALFGIKKEVKEEIVEPFPNSSKNQEKVGNTGLNNSGNADGDIFGNTCPFPVAQQASKEKSFNVGEIMQKYLKDATSDCEVSSTSVLENSKSTNTSKSKTSSKVHKKKKKKNKRNYSEVTSTTNNLPTERLRQKDEPLISAATKKNKRIPSDPTLARLNKEQPPSGQSVSSWLNAHNKPPRTPVTLTTDEHSIVQKYTTSYKTHKSSVIMVHITDNNLLITCAKDKVINITEPLNGLKLGSYELSLSPITSLVCSNNEDIYVVCHKHKSNNIMMQQSILLKVNYYKEGGGLKFNEKELFEYLGSMLTIHQTNTKLFVGARDGNVLVFDIDNEKLVTTLDCHSPHAVSCLTVGREGAREVLCCGSNVGGISVRSSEDGLLLRSLSGHNSSVNCLKLNNNLLYSGSSDRIVLVHNINTGAIVQRFTNVHGGSVKSLSLYNDNIITMCLDKYVRTLQTQPSKLKMSKTVTTLPLAMTVHDFGIKSGVMTTMCPHECATVVPMAYVGCRNGHIEVIPLTQLATKGETVIEISDEEEEVADKVANLQCKWGVCIASGFSNPSALLTHINLFHGHDLTLLDQCCKWDNCVHYFSYDLDTPLDVRLHIEKHANEKPTN